MAQGLFQVMNIQCNSQKLDQLFVYFLPLAPCVNSFFPQFLLKYAPLFRLNCGAFWGFLGKTILLVTLNRLVPLKGFTGSHLKLMRFKQKV